MQQLLVLCSNLEQSEGIESGEILCSQDALSKGITNLTHFGLAISYAISIYFPSGLSACLVPLQLLPHRRWFSGPLRPQVWQATPSSRYSLLYLSHFNFFPPRQPTHPLLLLKTDALRYPLLHFALLLSVTISTISALSISLVNKSPKSSQKSLITCPKICIPIINLPNYL